jgi:hypothetical protein
VLSLVFYERTILQVASISLVLASIVALFRMRTKRDFMALGQYPEIEGAQAVQFGPAKHF